MRTVIAMALVLSATVAQAVTVWTLQTDGSCARNDTTGVEFRNLDGTCNNLAGNGAWGSAGIPLRRLAPAAYADGAAAVRTSQSGAALPSGRAVSNAVVAQAGSIPNAKRVSTMLMQWGQFLDHDLDLTHSGHESMPIPIEPDDQPFGMIHGSGMPFHRSAYTDGVDTPRQQINALTAYIDGSQIYGVDSATAAALRSFSDGKLKMSANGLLHMEGGFFVSGDIRVNEQVGLTAMHTLFNREHNRLAEQVKAANPTFDDERVYQEARKINVAQMQAITYNEFLPALLGAGAPGDYGGYDASVDPGITNEFSTAAYRFGHSTLPPSLWRLDADGTAIANGHLPLHRAFFNPSLLTDPANGGIEPILRGLAAQQAQEVDTFLVDAVRNLLFPPPVDLQFDLAALNLQRGRDHGLQGYNETRRRVLGEASAYDDWDDAVFLPGVKDMLMSVYEDIDDVDLWIGGLGERHVNGGLLGELFAAIVADQFTRVRAGDRFWYQNGMFEPVWMQEIERSTIAEIMMRNTGIGSMQVNAFFVPVPGVLALLLIGLAGLPRPRDAGRAERPTHQGR